MLGHMGLDGFEIVYSPEKASVIVINTCSFIEAAKQESIDTILDLAEFKNRETGVCDCLVVSGCLPQRYAEDLEIELPEVDLFIGTGEYPKIVPLLKAKREGREIPKSHVDIPKFIHTEYDPRINTSPSYMAWLKVSEGCNRNCTFCIIPTIRGRLRSRTVSSLVAEAENLVKTGVRELNLISQDLSDFGKDKGESLFDLLVALEEVKGVDWIRLFYFYPDDLTDEVMDLMAKSKKICPYLDMPVQHFSNSVLKRMNRKITGEEILGKIKKLKSKIPHIVLRTSIIVGFPGETEEDFQKLIDGITEAGFDHLGIFRYSDEDNTPAEKLTPKVSQDIIEERFDRLFEVQSNLVEDNNQKYIGKTVDVLVEGEHEETEMLIVGRSKGQAPDVDGKVIINDLGDVELKVGDIVPVLIQEVHEFDLVGKINQNC
jgi:ribosomal protein S12 methylthiotransferase